MRPWPAVLLLAALQGAPGAPAIGAAAIPGAQVRSTVEEVLARPEYRRLRHFREPSPPPPAEPRTAPGAGARPAERLPPPRVPEPPAATFSIAPGLVGALRIGLFALLAIAVVALAALVIRQWGRQWGRSAPEAEGPILPEVVSPASATPPGERPPDEYLQQALGQARAGRHREALRLLLLGAMSFIERKGLIRHRKGLTNSDYLRAVRREAAVRGSLEPIVLAFDEVYFGRRGATAERFEECLRHYRAGFPRA